MPDFSGASLKLKAEADCVTARSRSASQVRAPAGALHFSLKQQMRNSDTVIAASEAVRKSASAICHALEQHVEAIDECHEMAAMFDDTAFARAIPRLTNTTETLRDALAAYSVARERMREALDGE